MGYAIGYLLGSLLPMSIVGVRHYRRIGDGVAAVRHALSQHIVVITAVLFFITILARAAQNLP